MRPYVPLGTLRALLDRFIALERHRFAPLGPKISGLLAGTRSMTRSPDQLLVDADVTDSALVLIEPKA